MLKIDEGDVNMMNQHACHNIINERMSAMQKNEIPVVKADVKRVYKDITQTKEFWSNLAVIS